MTATFPTAYPFPVASGGLEHASHVRPLRGPPAAFIRQPYLGLAPAVSAVSGFGTGAGAFIANNGSDADQSQGMVRIRCGLAPTASGSIALAFPGSPLASSYVALADWAAISNPIALAGGLLTIAWTANRPLLPNQTIHLAYQWAVSQ